MKKSRFLRLKLFLSCALFAFYFSANAQRNVKVSQGVEAIAVSPDGTQIAASIFGKLWLIPVQGGTAKQLTFGFGWDSNPEWSEDGSSLAYSHQTPQGGHLQLYNFETATTRTIYTTQRGWIDQIELHSGKKRAFFLIDTGQYESHLWSVTMNGLGAKQHTEGDKRHEWSFALSESGNEVLIPQGRYGAADLYLKSVDSDTVSRLTRTRLIDERDVVWNHQDKSYLLIERINGVDYVAIRGENDDSSRRIFNSPYSKKQLSLLPDGKEVIMLDQRKLFRLNLETGRRTPLPFEANFNLPELPPADLIITNVNVFDAVGDTLQLDMAVEVRNGRISAIKKRSRVRNSGNTKVIDGEGKTLIPGLMDNHFHFWHYMAFWGDSFLLSKGVTTIREVGAEISQSMNLKEAMSYGFLGGPTIYTTGPLIDGDEGYHPMVDVPMTDPAALDPLVKSLKEQGAEALKAYFMLDSAMMKPLTDAAAKYGLPVTGHIGVKIGWKAAAEAGIKGFNHIRVWRDLLPLKGQPDGTNESLEGGIHPIERMQADWSQIDLDDPKVTELLDYLAANNVAMDPTVGIQQVGDFRKSQVDFETFYISKTSFEKAKQFVRMAYERGVLILAGTDSGNLHAEMQHYADAGIPTHAVLKSATINGAKWLGKESEFGTIEVGKRADLVLIDGNPLVDMKDIEKVALVVKEGRIVFRN